MEMLDRPTALQIELHNYCNAKCIFCPVPKMKRKRGFMDFKLFQKIIDDAAGIPTIGVVLPFLNGEPLLDPKVVKKIKYINEKMPNSGVAIFTNASLLNEEFINALKTEIKVGAIYVSLNTGNPRKYNEMMGLNFENTMKNLKNLMQKKPPETEVIISVIDRYVTIEDLNKMVMQIGEGGRFIVAHYKNWAGNSNISQEEVELQKGNCPRLEQMFVLWDGRVTQCCMMAEGEVILGDLNTQTILEVYNSEKFVELRKKMKDGKRSEVPYCANCTGA